MPEVREGGETVINKTELLPCPICGGQPDFQHFNITPKVKGRIVCACGIELRQGENDTEDDMCIIWNTRAPVEYDGWFYLPKPKENIVQYGAQRTEKTEHGYKVTQPVEVIESAIRSWGDELGEYIMKRICEAWSTRSALGNGTCVITPIVPNSDMGRCSACGQIADVASNYCWRCGAKAVR